MTLRTRQTAFGDKRVGDVSIKDKEGNKRIVIAVKPDGSPAIQFFDASGKLVSELPSKQELHPASE